MDYSGQILAEWERELLGFKTEHCGMDSPHLSHQWVNHPKKSTDGAYGNWCAGSWSFDCPEVVDSFLES